MSVTKPSSKPSDIDISTNEALLHHAEASRLAKSWLFGVFGDESSTASIEDERDDFDKNVAKKPFLYSDTGGIGYVEPTDVASSGPRSSDPATAFLRKQMLGRGGANQHTFTKGLPHPRSGHPLRRRRNDDRDEEDEEEGRSGLGKSKSSKHKLSKPKVSSSAEAMNGGDEIVPPREASSEDTAPSNGHHTKTAVQETNPTKKRGSSFLDEILASRASKKKKKKSGKGDDG